ncbi:MAG TPA: hypothetical protein VKA19_11495 [Alphaproteobacteria bacterium]|nr:hypothetical protein [Alphaproteobacteria bacterium]
MSEQIESAVDAIASGPMPSETYLDELPAHAIERAISRCLEERRGFRAWKLRAYLSNRGADSD